MLLLRQTVPTSDGNDVYQERRYYTLFLFCEVPEKRSHLQERPAEAEVDNVLREEGTWLRKGLEPSSGSKRQRLLLL